MVTDNYANDNYLRTVINCKIFYVMADAKYLYFLFHPDLNIYVKNIIIIIIFIL